jgi:hypothetical protein
MVHESKIDANLFCNALAVSENSDLNLETLNWEERTYNKAYRKPR